MVQEILNRKFKKTVWLVLIPQCINVIITFYCLFFRSSSEFLGAILGTILGVMFFVIWLLIAKRVSLANVLVLFAYSLGAFPVKLILFALFVFGGFYFFSMDRYFFVFTFLFSLLFSLVIEVLFILSINKVIKENKQEQV